MNATPVDTFEFHEHVDLEAGTVAILCALVQVVSDLEKNHEQLLQFFVLFHSHYSFSKILQALV